MEVAKAMITLLFIPRSKTMNDFKDGIADALLYGNMKENNVSDMYKQGYDFGITIYCELKEQD